MARSASLQPSGPRPPQPATGAEGPARPRHLPAPQRQGPSTSLQRASRVEFCFGDTSPPPHSGRPPGSPGLLQVPSHFRGKREPGRQAWGLPEAGAGAFPQWPMGPESVHAAGAGIRRRTHVQPRGPPTPGVPTPDPSDTPPTQGPAAPRRARAAAAPRSRPDGGAPGARDLGLGWCVCVCVRGYALGFPRDWERPRAAAARPGAPAFPPPKGGRPTRADRARSPPRPLAAARRRALAKRGRLSGHPLSGASGGPRPVPCAPG